MKRFLIMAICILLCFAVGCAPKEVTGTAATDSEQEQQPVETGTGEQPPETPPEPIKPWAIDPNDDPPPAAPPWEREPREEQSLNELTENTIQITITMENGGEIVAELYPDLAPQTVRNFVYLARLGFYDGLRFHRIMSGFMIQGGCPYSIDGGSKGTPGTGNPGYSIWGEFTENGFENNLRHARGILSMARTNDPNSAGSQFFIMHEMSPSLDNKYASFGRVISGMEVVDEIAATPNSGANGAVAPENMPVIRSITVDDDVELPPPEKLPR